MSEHSFVNQVCRYCGATFVAGEDQRSCLSHKEREAIPRPVPTSVFAEIDPIYARIQELRRERDAQLAEPMTIEPAA